MATKRIAILLTILLSMVCTKGFPYYDFVKDNIYYIIINDKELSVAKGTDSYSGEIVIPEEVTYKNKTRKVTNISSYAFLECRGLTSITIPSSVKEIDFRAFSNCVRLTTVTIPNSVTLISGKAFEDCTSLTSIFIGNNVKSIGENAFYGCNSLKSVHVSDLTIWFNIDFKNLHSNPLFYSHHLFIDGNEINDLVIPDGVTKIGNYTFSGNSCLTSVIIPNTVSQIGIYAFYDCVNLKSATIPNSVTSIGDFAFSECPKLFSISIPNNVTVIGYSTFKGCRGLTSVTIPNSVTEINNFAFSDCKKLASVYIPDGVIRLGEESFSGCGLTSVTIPNSVEYIGKSAFRNCDNLTSMVIGSSAKYILDNAFDSDNLMTVVSLLESVPVINDAIDEKRTFSINTYKEGILYVPKGKINGYKKQFGWRSFSRIEEGFPSSITRVCNDDIMESKRYTLNGKYIEIPQKGINVIKFNNGITKKLIVK